MRKILSMVLVMVLLASAVSLGITPAAAAQLPYQKKIIGDADENNELTKAELSNAILPYMLEEGGAYVLDDVGDAAYVYAYWSGQPKTITDQYGRSVTLYRPPERIIAASRVYARTVVQLGMANNIVGAYRVVSSTSKPLVLTAYPELGELPVVSSGTGQENIEKMVSLNPDVVFGSFKYADTIYDVTGIPTVCIKTPTHFEEGGSLDAYIVAGKAMDKEERAEELISYFNDKVTEITDITSQIPDDEKIKVYLINCCQGRGAITRTWGNYQPAELAGGINVAKNTVIESGSSYVTKEQIIYWDPDVILVHGSSKTPWLSIDHVLADEDLQTAQVKAVINENINYTKGYYMGWDPATGTTEIFYMAKLFYPDKFNDLDVEEECNEILENFYGVDGLWTHLLDNTNFYSWK